MSKVLVAFSTVDCFKQAKQLFSSAYYYGGWRGDYLLLTTKEAGNKVKWFNDRGIITMKRSLFCDEKFWVSNQPKNAYPPFASLLIHLFGEEFEKWDNVVYLDKDIIVKGKLHALGEVNGFWAVPEFADFPLGTQFIFPKKLLSDKEKKAYKELSSTYDLNKPSFNNGVLAFSTDCIGKGVQKTFLQVLKKYGIISRHSFMTLANLVFYEKWKKLPRKYNIMPNFFSSELTSKQKLNDGIIHFAGLKKPWSTSNYFYQDWKNNLEKADMIKTNKRRESFANYKVNLVNKYFFRLYLFQFFMEEQLWKIDRYIGKIGIYLKNRNHNLYRFFKKILSRIPILYRFPHENFS